MIDYATVTRALLYGTAPTGLKLSYTVKDPAAVRLELIAVHKSWHVARQRLRDTLDAIDATALDDDAECASTVHCSPFAVEGRTLLVLRQLCPMSVHTHACSRYPMTVCTDALRRFLDTTYRMCPAVHEQHLIAAELDAQLAMFATTTQEGRQP